MTAERRSEVIVVGGGPAGAATAWALAKNGVDVLVLDRAHFPRAKPCAEYLSPEAARLLNEMGALAPLEAEGATTLGGMRVHVRDQSFEGRFAGAHRWRGFRDRGLAVRRERLDALLLDGARAAGAGVEEGVRVLDLIRDANGRVTGVAADRSGIREEFRAAHVVGADGLRSVVARRLGLARRLRWPERYAFVTHYSGVSGVGDCGEMHVFDDGYCGLAPVGGGVVNVAVVTSATGALDASGDSVGFLERWLAHHPSLATRLTAAERVAAVQVTGPFASRARRAWAAGASLVGDAADFYDPFTGEGIYAALRGAELMTPYVVEALRAPDALRAAHSLAAYDRCRRHEFGGKWALERLVSIAVAHPALLARVAVRLRERCDLADLLVGVTGDFVPVREVLNLRYAAALLGPGASHQVAAASAGAA